MMVEALIMLCLAGGCLKENPLQGVPIFASQAECVAYMRDHLGAEGPDDQLIAVRGKVTLRVRCVEVS